MLVTGRTFALLEGLCLGRCLLLVSRVPPPPRIVSGGGGGQGIATFHFANILTRLGIEYLRCVCWLDKVVLLVHCCVLQISCIQSTPLYPVSCRTLQFFATSAMDVDHIDTYPAGVVVNFQRSGGSIVPAKILSRAKPSTKSAARPSLQPSLQLESPFLWPLLRMCSYSESSTPARKSGTEPVSE